MLDREVITVDEDKVIYSINFVGSSYTIDEDGKVLNITIKDISRERSIF